MFTTSRRCEFADIQGLLGRGAIYAEIGFAEMNSVKIIRGISNIQACYTILIVSIQIQLLTLKKHEMGSLK
jgi:hypothetical protein